MPTAGHKAAKDKEDVPARWVAFPLHMAVVCLLLAPADYLGTAMLCTACWHVLLAPLGSYGLAKLVRQTVAACTYRGSMAGHLSAAVDCPHQDCELCRSSLLVDWMGE